MCCLLCCGPQARTQRTTAQVCDQRTQVADRSAPAPPFPPHTSAVRRWQVLNPASMKQALVEGAVRLPDLNLYEQASGNRLVL